jgi:hypothetical protein
LFLPRPAVGINAAVNSWDFGRPLGQLYSAIKLLHFSVQRNAPDRVGGNVGHWYESEVRQPMAYVGYRGKTGKRLLVLSFTGFDPNWSFGSIHATAYGKSLTTRWKRGIIGPCIRKHSRDCLWEVTDHAMEAWYHWSIA